MGKLHQDKKKSVNDVGMVGIGVGIGKVNKEYALKVENSYFVEWEGKDGSAVHKELIGLGDEGVVLDVDVGGTADAVSGKVGRFWATFQDAQVLATTTPATGRFLSPFRTQGPCTRSMGTVAELPRRTW